jgi:hypothetical protein
MFKLIIWILVREELYVLELYTSHLKTFLTCEAPSIIRKIAVHD